MAIRKMRKKMKPVIFIITIGFFISMLTVIVSNISMGLKNKQYAFKVNGEKVAMQDVERGINNINNQYSQYFQTPLDRDDAKILAVDSVITTEILKNIGKELKIKVSSSELKTKMNVIEKQIPDKNQFKRMLQAQGFTKKTFEKYIKDSILVEKTNKKILEQAKVTDEEIVKEYNENKYGAYLGKTLEEAKPAIEKSLRERKGNKELLKMVEKEKRNIKIEDIREQYGNVLPKVVYEEDGFAITDVDVLRAALYQAYYGVKDLKVAKENATAELKNEIKFAKVAMEKGAKRDEELPVTSQLMDLKMQLVEKIRKEINPTDAELKTYFNTNKQSYDTEASVDAKIIDFIIKSTDADEKIAQEKAEKILKEVTPENFSEMAKKYSEGPSAPNGGDLGWFGKGQMIPEFEAAAFEGKTGEIYPKVVKTQFGYHIIFVENKKDDNGKEEVKASHILIKVTPSEETYTKVMETAKMVAEEIKTNKLTFKDAVMKEYSKFKTAEYLDIKKDGYLKGIGYEDELTKALYSSKLGEINALRTEKGIYVFEKTKEVKFEEATFEKVKDRVIYDYKNEKLMEEIQKLQN